MPRASVSQAEFSNKPSLALSKSVDQEAWQLVLTALATISFILTALFARDTLGGKSKLTTSIFPLSSALTILRILQGVTSTLMVLLFDQTLELLLWKLVSREKGLRFLSLLAISPKTGFIGVFKLIYRSTTDIRDRVWATLRILTPLLIWLAGIVLFVETTVERACYSSAPFSVIAGSGTFNGTFVQEVLRGQNGSISYWVLASAFNFITNPRFSFPATPISCTVDDDCDAYIFPGALWSMSPSIPENTPGDILVDISTSPALQVEFKRGFSTADSFNRDNDCHLYTDAEGQIAVFVCLASSQVFDGSIIAGVWACTAGSENGQCLVSGSSFNVTLTMTAFRRRASTICALMNNTILSVSNLGEPIQSPIDVNGLEIALNWLLNFSAAGLPAVSSIPYLFWNADEKIGIRDWSVDAYQSFKSILTFPIWEFAPNNYGDPFKEPLPEEFHTTAAICKPYDRIVVNSGMLITYNILQSLLLFGAWTFTVWCYFERSIIPNLSAFPLIDFVAKLIDKDSLDQNHLLLSDKMDKLRAAASAGVLSTLRDSIAVSNQPTGCIEARDSESATAIEPDTLPSPFTSIKTIGFQVERAGGHGGGCLY